KFISPMAQPESKRKQTSIYSSTIADANKDIQSQPTILFRRLDSDGEKLGIAVDRTKFDRTSRYLKKQEIQFSVPKARDAETERGYKIINIPLKDLNEKQKSEINKTISNIGEPFDANGENSSYDRYLKQQLTIKEKEDPDRLKNLTRSKFSQSNERKNSSNSNKDKNSTKSVSSQREDIAVNNDENSIDSEELKTQAEVQDLKGILNDYEPSQALVDYLELVGIERESNLEKLALEITFNDVLWIAKKFEKALIEEGVIKQDLSEMMPIPQNLEDRNKDFLLTEATADIYHDKLLVDSSEKLGIASRQLADILALEDMVDTYKFSNSSDLIKFYETALEGAKTTFNKQFDRIGNDLIAKITPKVLKHLSYPPERSRDIAEQFLRKVNYLEDPKLSSFLKNIELTSKTALYATKLALSDRQLSTAVAEAKNKLDNILNPIETNDEKIKAQCYLDDHPHITDLLVKNFAENSLNSDYFNKIAQKLSQTEIKTTTNENQPQSPGEPRVHGAENTTQTTKQTSHNTVDSQDKENTIEESTINFVDAPELKLTNSNVKLTKSQVNALKKMIDFSDQSINNNNASRQFLLSGYAGTGKTFLVQQLLENIKDKKVVFTAPTNKAVKVLAAFAEKENLKVDTKTTHSLLGLKQNVNKKTGVVTYKAPRKKPKIEYDLVVVDESSMLDSKLYKHIKNLADSGVKVLYMGDPAQLPPVGENESKVFSELSKSNYTANLTEVVRYGNEIGVVAENIRKNLNADKTFFSSTVNENILAEKPQDWFENIIKEFQSDEYKNNPDRCKILAHTNQRVKELNQKVRQKLWGNDCAEFVVGDRIIANSSCLDEFENIILHTSDEITVTKATKIEKDNYKVWQVTGKATESDEDIVLNIVAPESKTKFLNDLKKLADKAHQATHDWDRSNAWDEFHAHNNKYHDINHAYALTIHKSQGSTFDIVAIDEQNINATIQGLTKKSNNDQEIADLQKLRNQLRYVAVTRAKNKVLVTNKQAYYQQGQIDKEDSASKTDSLKPELKTEFEKIATTYFAIKVLLKNKSVEDRTKYKNSLQQMESAFGTDGKTKLIKSGASTVARAYCNQASFDEIKEMAKCAFNPDFKEIFSKHFKTDNLNKTTQATPTAAIKTQATPTDAIKTQATPTAHKKTTATPTHTKKYKSATPPQ
ncbi:MAG: AAA family ATPase, partial [Prochloraceae cyanobacterium]